MNAPTSGWLGYDWLKLIVAIVLLLLLLIFWLGGSRSAAVSAPPTATAAAALAAASTAPAAAAPTMAPAAATATPAAPTVAPAVALAAPVLVSPAAGAQIPAGKVAFSGSAAPNSDVELLVDGASIGTAKTGPDGKWSFEGTIAAAGDHTVIAQALDPGGAVAAASNPIKLSIGAVALAAPAINAPSGSLSSGAATLSGTGAPGSNVEIVVDDQVAGQATVAADGTWALPITLAAGDHTIIARALDSAGQPGTASAPIKLVLAATGTPASTDLAISSPADGAQLGAEPFTMTGTGPPGSTIEILDSDKVIGNTTVSEDGTWRLEITPGGSTAAYGLRTVGAADVAAKPIRITFGTAQADACTALAANCDAWVTREQGRSLRLRAGPGTDQRVLNRLPVGTQLKLLEGPQAANGYSWWRVQTLGGQAGWVAGEELRLQPD